MNLSHIINSERNPVNVKVVGGSTGGGTFGGSFETDSEGNQVLRIVDAAPFAYDPNTDSKKTSVVASKSVVSEVFSISDTLNGGETVVEIRPSPRKVWKIQSLNIDVASISGSTGNHDIYLRLGSNSSRADILNASSDSTTRMISVRGSFGSNVNASPSDPVMQQQQVKGIYVSEDCPLYVVYQNKSDTPSTGTTYISVSAVEEGEL